MTIIEVLASALLIFLGLGAIFAMNTQSLEILRSTRLLANGSQVLQERMETMRTRPWPEVANATALATLWRTPAPSERELGGASLTETVIVSVPDTPGGRNVDNTVFKIQRRNGTVTVQRPADLTAQPLLLVDLTIAWQERQQTKQRQLRTIIGRSGLTRSGIFGSAFGRPSPAISRRGRPMKRSRPRHAFTLAEMLIAMVGTSIVIGALLFSSLELQRSLHASETYASSQSDQRRLLDCIARDMRRSIGVATSTAVNGSGGVRLAGSSATIEGRTSLVLTLPGYYQSNTPAAAGYQPLEVVPANNYVDYGTGTEHARECR